MRLEVVECVGKKERREVGTKNSKSVETKFTALENDDQYVNDAADLMWSSTLTRGTGTFSMIPRSQTISIRGRISSLRGCLST